MPIITVPTRDANGLTLSANVGSPSNAIYTAVASNDKAVFSIPLSDLDPSAPNITQNGITLTGSSQRFRYTDPEQNANTIYDFTVGSSEGADDVFNLAGNSEYKDLFVDVNGIPTDGRTLYITLFAFREGPGSPVTSVSSVVTADTIN